MQQIFLDTETTGLNPKQGDRIVEVAAIKSVDHRLATGPSGVFHHLLDPECEIPPETTAIHGIADKDIAGKPKFSDIAAELADFLQGNEIVIHNARFDCKFLDAEFERVKMPPIAKIAGKITDSLAIARSRFPGQRNDLDSVLERCGIDVEERRPRHGAELDARLLGEVFPYLTGEIEPSAEDDVEDEFDVDFEDSNRPSPAVVVIGVIVLIVIGAVLFG